jgi:hypothetical protein
MARSFDVAETLVEQARDAARGWYRVRWAGEGPRMLSVLRCQGPCGRVPGHPERRRRGGAPVDALWVAACPDEAAKSFAYLSTAAATSLYDGTDLQIMFGVGGERDLSERVLPPPGRLAGQRPGQGRQRGLDPASGRCLRRAARGGRPTAGPDRRARSGHPGLPGRRRRYRRAPLGRQGPGHLGDPRRRAGFRVLEGHVLGGAGPRRALAGKLGAETGWRAGWPRPWPWPASLSGRGTSSSVPSPTSTMSASWPRKSPRPPVSCSATSPRPSATSDSSTPPGPSPRPSVGRRPPLAADRPCPGPAGAKESRARPCCHSSLACRPCTPAASARRRRPSCQTRPAAADRHHVRLHHDSRHLLASRHRR